MSCSCSDSGASHAQPMVASSNGTYTCRKARAEYCVGPEAACTCMYISISIDDTFDRERRWDEANAT